MRIAQFSALIVSLVVISGCGAQKTVAVGPNGEKVTTDGSGNIVVDDGKGNVTEMKSDKDGSVTVKTKEGAEATYSKDGMSGTNEKGEKFEFGKSEVTEAEIGLAFYPGSSATNEDMKMEEKGKKTFLSTRTTSDDPSKVVDHYKSLLKDVSTFSSADTATISGKLEDGRQVTIIALKADGKTRIQMTVTPQ